MTLETLLAQWQTLQILKSFAGIIRRRLTSGGPSGAVRSLDGPAELKTAFFGERVYLGDRVRLSGRLSQYCPLYLPIAYSPQAHFSDQTGVQWMVDYNPAPTSMFSRAGSGCTLAFLFHQDARETPRVISKYHPDRTQPIPFHLADPGIPVLIDGEGERRVEEIVDVTATIVRLDESVAAAISASDEAVVKLYYHTFFDADFIPQKGYILDARVSSGGAIRPISRESLFETSVGVELSLKTKLDIEQVDDLIGKTLGEYWPGGASHYQPAYYTPGGYQIKQVSSGPMVFHYAPSLGVLNSAVVIDTANPDRDTWRKLLVPCTTELLQRIRAEDPEAAVEPLFASEPSLFRRVGVV